MFREFGVECAERCVFATVDRTEYDFATWLRTDAMALIKAIWLSMEETYNCNVCDFGFFRKLYIRLLKTILAPADFHEDQCMTAAEREWADLQVARGESVIKC